MSFHPASWCKAYFLSLSDWVQVCLAKNSPRWIDSINTKVNPVEHMITDLIGQAPCVELFGQDQANN